VYVVPAVNPFLVKAADASTGEVRWSASLDGQVAWVQPVDGALYVAGNTGTTRLDIGTGAVVWAKPERFTIASAWPGGPLLAAAQRADSVAGPVSVLEPTTGAVLWSVATEIHALSRAGVVETDCGRVTLRDWTDGHAVWTLGDAPGSCAATPPLALAGIIVVAQVQEAWVGIDLADGTQRWRRDHRSDEAGVAELDDRRVVLLGAKGTSLDVASGADGPVSTVTAPGRLVWPDGAVQPVVIDDVDPRWIRTVDPATGAYVGGEVPLGSAASPGVLSADTAYVLDGSGDKPALIARSVYTGAPRWSMVVDGLAHLLAVGDRVVVLRVRDELVAYG
jgi:outer membrane protein assembly factor BamB